MLAYVILNSSGVDLHKNPIGKVGFLIFFQTPVEQIYTKQLLSHLKFHNNFKLQWSKFTLIAPSGVGKDSGNFKLQWRKFTLSSSLSGCVFRIISNSSGVNLHRARNSIFLGYEYLKFIFLPLKFR